MSQAEKITGRNYAGFGIILSINFDKSLKILVIQENPEYKKKEWKDFFLKFPGGNLDFDRTHYLEKDDQLLAVLTGARVMSEVCGLSFKRLSDTPFFSYVRDNHIANFYLAVLDDSLSQGEIKDPFPCSKKISFADFIKEETLRARLWSDKILRKHAMALASLFRSLDLIRYGGEEIPKEARPLKEYFDSL